VLQTPIRPPAGQGRQSDAALGSAANPSTAVAEVWEQM